MLSSIKAKMASFWIIDDWITAVCLFAQLLFFIVVVSGRIPPFNNIELSTIPYNLQYATTGGAGRSCSLIGLPSNFQHCVASYWASYFTFPCSPGLCGPGDNDMTFKYLWYAPQHVEAGAFSAVAGQPFAGGYLAFDMNKYSQVALPPTSPFCAAAPGVCLGLIPYKWAFIFAKNDTAITNPGIANSFFKALANAQIPVAMRAGYSNVYLADDYNRFGVGISDVLTRYNLNLASTSITILNNPDNYVSELQKWERFLNTLPADTQRTPPGAPAYNNDLSNQMIACNAEANLRMSCQEVVPEPTFDYVVRLFGYCLFIQMAAAVLILIVHAVQNQAGSSANANQGANNAMVPSASSPRNVSYTSSKGLQRPLLSQRSNP